MLFANYGRPFLVLSCLLAGKVEGMTGIGGGAAALRVFLPHSAPLSSLARFSARVPLLSACGAFALGSCIRFRSSHASASWLFLVLSVFCSLFSWTLALYPWLTALCSKLYGLDWRSLFFGSCLCSQLVVCLCSRLVAYLCSWLVPLLSDCTFALGLCLCSRLVSSRLMLSLPVLL